MDGRRRYEKDGGTEQKKKKSVGSMCHVSASVAFLRVFFFFISVCFRLRHRFPLFSLFFCSCCLASSPFNSIYPSRSIHPNHGNVLPRMSRSHISVTAVIAAAHVTLAHSRQPTPSAPVFALEGQVARITGTDIAPFTLHSQALQTFRRLQETDIAEDPTILWLKTFKANSDGSNHPATAVLTRKSKEPPVTIIIDSDDDRASDDGSTISWSDSDREMDQEDHDSSRDSDPLLAVLLSRNAVKADLSSGTSEILGDRIQVTDTLLLVEQGHKGRAIVTCIGQPISTCCIFKKAGAPPTNSPLAHTGIEASLPLTLPLQQPVKVFDPLALLDSTWDRPAAHTIETEQLQIVNLSYIWTLGLESAARRRSLGIGDGAQETGTILQRHLCFLTSVKTCLLRAICAECENEYRNQLCVFGCSSKRWRLDIQMECTIRDGTGEATLKIGKDQEAVAWTLLGLQKSTFTAPSETRADVCVRVLKILSRRGVLSFKSKSSPSGTSEGQVESMDNDVSQRAKEEEKLWLDICLGRLASQSVRRGTFILHATVAPPAFASSSPGSKSAAAPFLKTSVLVGRQHHLTLIPSLPTLNAVGVEWIKPAKEANMLLASLLHNP